jgi:hypothetical protein
MLHTPGHFSYCILWPERRRCRVGEAILAPLKKNTRAGTRYENRPANRAGRKVRGTALSVPRHSSTAVGNVCYILWSIFQSWRREQRARRRKPLEKQTSWPERRIRGPGYTMCENQDPGPSMAGRRGPPWRCMPRLWHRMVGLSCTFRVISLRVPPRSSSAGIHRLPWAPPTGL